jgi:hypothetical protein
MTVHTKIEPAPFVNDERLADMWRGNGRAIEDHLLFINSHLRTIAAGKERPAYIEQCQKNLAYRLPLYLAAVRRRSEAEHRMDIIGVEYARSPHHWTKGLAA